MRKFTKVMMLSMMLLAVSAMTFAQSIQRGPDISDEEWEWIQSQQPKKGPIGTYNPSDYPAPTRQGGETIATATVIGSLPYTDNGTTSGYVDDYDVGGASNTAPDVVYSFTPTEDMILDAVSLCGSSYDTKIGVYEDDYATEIAYNDDDCGLQSAVYGIPLTTGHTYYIIVDGYGSASGTYTLNVTQYIPPPGPDPIVSFPFEEDYESGDFSVYQGYTENAQSAAYVGPDPTGASSFVGRTEGDGATGWSGGSTSTSYNQAFNTNVTHIASIDMIVEPSGAGGDLTMEFDLRQGYDFGNKYSWFRVLVNDVAIEDVNGNLSFNPETEDDDPFARITYDLTAYQNETSFTLTLQGSGKYDDCYSEIDNFEIYYLAFGDVYGYVFNYDGLPVNEAIVALEGGPNTLTTADGSYSMTNVMAGARNISAGKAGYNTITDAITIPADGAIQHDFTLTQPNMVVNPLLLDVEVNPEEYYETSLGILNNGSGPLDWEATINYLTDNTAGISNVRASSSNVSEAHSGNASNASTRAQFDLQFSFDADGPSGLTGLAGSETDGNYIYATKWADNQIVKFNMDGTFVEIFTISGVTGLRDLAYDGQYFYGGAASGTIYEMDFDNQVLVSSISSPEDVRAIAYDSDNDAFWVNNWDSDLTLVGRDGSQLTTISTPPSIYGMAYDNWSDGGPYLWLFSGTTSGGGSQLEQMEIASGSLTGLSHSVSGDLGDLIAGGLWTQPGIVPGYVTLGGLGQGTPDIIFGYELVEGGSTGGNWLSLDNTAGTVPAFGGSYNVGVNFNAAGMTAGEVHTAEIVFASNPNVGTITIPVTMTVVGDPLAGPSDLNVEITNMASGAVSMSWTGVATNPTFNHYVIKRNGNTVTTTTNTTYSETLPDYGEYCYAVYANYDDGNSVPAGPECVNWLLPEATVDPLALSAEVFEGEMVEVTGLTISNTGMNGSMLTYNIGIDPAAGFIHSARPNTGVLGAGQTADIVVVYDADGYTAGVYNQSFTVVTNDLNNPSVDVANEMTVLQPATFAGQVTDGNNGMPIQGVTVSATGTAGEWTAETNDLGNYTLNVEEGTFDLTFAIEGYQSVTVEDLEAFEGDVTTVDAQMFEEAYPPQFVTATVNDDDTECLVEWGAPAGPYLVVYDDGTAENMFAWNNPGNVNAVKFTPAAYPAVVTGGEIFIGEGFFPQGGNVIGTSFGVAVYDDDGANGMPGTVLDSVTVDVTDFGWVTVSGLNAAVTEGDFYLGMIQGGYAPNTAGIGIDESLPVAYKSYQKPASGDWMVSSYQDFMIRAIVDGPQINVTDGFVADMIVPNVKKDVKIDGFTMNEYSKIAAGREMAPEYLPYTGLVDMRGVEMYTITRFANFDPNDPADLGDATLLDNDLTTNSYVDAAFANLPMGYYKYGVTAIFTNGDESDYAISNVVGHLMRYDVTINVTTTDGESAEGAIIRFNGTNFPQDEYYEIVPASESLTLEDVWRGEYALKVFKPGYYQYVLPTVLVYDELTIDVVLQEGRFPVRDLYVDPLTSIATWNEPLPGTVLFEDFEGETFPPEGWTSSTEGEGWFRSDNGGSPDWPIPAGDGFYAVTNDDAAGSTNDACCDYLVSPSVDLGMYADFLLVFDSYFDAAWGGSAYVEYSTDGNTWDELHALTAAAAWTEVAVDLADWSGANADGDFWFRFHYDDNGAFADGWAVDNVTVASSASMIFRDGTDELMGYEVYLDGSYVASTNETTYHYTGLTYGQTYEAAVSALYSSGTSEKMYYTFTSSYLIPPDSLQGEGLENQDVAYLTWAPPLTPSTSIARVTESLPASTVEQTAAMDKQDNAREVHESTYNASMSPVRGSTAYALAGYYGEYEWVNFDTDTPGTFNMINPDPATAGYAGTFIKGDNDFIYMVDDVNQDLHKVNITDGTATLIGPTGVSASNTITDMAGDRNTGTVYAITGTELYTIDVSSGTATMVGSLGNAGGLMIAIACDADGNLWGHDIGDDNIYSIDPASGASSIVGPTGVDANYAQSMGYDYATNTLFMAWYGGGLNGELRIVDTQTGATSSAGALSGGAEVTILTFPGGSSGPGPGGEIPENLIGYNVYRDAWGEGATPIAYVEGALNTEFTEYDMQPGTYEYAVTAVYDLTEYGFPGETGESAIEGPVEVVISYGYELPFTELWTVGNFGSQQWTTDCDNWWVNGNAGNPAPAAEFTWDDPMTDYECGLISYALKASEYEEGALFLDFDLKLDDRNSTGDEKLIVRIYENGEWSDVAEFSNNGDMDWTAQHIDLSGDGMGADFQLGFFATGANTADIFGWMIDNIEVYHVCPAPFELTAEIDDPTVELNWMSPDTVGPVAEWLHYDDGVNFSAIGFDGPGDFDVAIRFEPSQLGDYDETYLTQVSFFPSEVQCEYSIRVWTGANAGTMIVDQLVVDPIIGAWNTVTLDNPVMVDASQELWIGYRNNAQAGFPAGTDAGPAVAGYGDMLYDPAAGWISMFNDIGLDYNWNIQGYVTSETDGVVALGRIEDVDRKVNEGTVEVASPAVQTAASVFEPSTRAFVGYNIFRSHDGGAYELINQDLVTETSYVDEVTTGGMYCYYIQSIFEGCESDSSNNVCVISTVGIEDQLSESGLVVYPNPANDLINVASSSNIERVTVMNYVGQIVSDRQVTGANEIQISTNNIEDGIYFIKIETKDGIVTEKVTVAR